MGLRGNHRLLPGKRWTDSPLALSLDLFPFNRSKNGKRDQGEGRAGIRMGRNGCPAVSNSLSTVQSGNFTWSSWLLPYL